MPNKVDLADKLYHDATIHALVYEAFDQTSVISKHEILIPTMKCWMQPGFDSWSAYRDSLPPHLQESGYAILSQRIFPLPAVTREALIETYCPIKFIRQAKKDVNNKDCLVRIYLGRREVNKRRAESQFSLRNFGLLVNEMEKLEMDTALLARTMATALSVLHWKAGVDGNDVEFVIGSKPFERTRPSAAELESTSKDGVEHSRHDLDFRKRINHIWLLDFGECSKFKVEASDGWVTKLVNAFYVNDPYYPRPISELNADISLWRTFKTTYLEASAHFTSSDAPQKFITAVEKEGINRRKMVAIQGTDSLLGTLIR